MAKQSRRISMEKGEKEIEGEREETRGVPNEKKDTDDLYWKQKLLPIALRGDGVNGMDARPLRRADVPISGHYPKASISSHWFYLLIESFSDDVGRWRWSVMADMFPQPSPDASSKISPTCRRGMILPV